MQETVADKALSLAKEMTYAERESTLRQEFGGVAVKDTSEAPGQQVLYDQIDGTVFHPKDGPEHSHYLKMRIAKCSACDYTGIQIGAIHSHLEQVRASAEEHKDAVLLPIPGADGRGGGFSCSGCGTPFVSRPQNARRHIDKVIQAAPLHEGAVALVMNRFSLEPRTVQEPVTTPVAPVSLDSDVNQKARSRVRGRRRHRNRHRGGA